MHTLFSLILGYFVGCISPAKLVSQRHDVNLKESGTGNLGATNTALVLGKKAGYFVLFFDIFKSFFSYRLARFLFPQLALAGLISSIGVIIGHAYPIFNGFQGGKSLASFGGMILAHDPLQFAVLLALGLAMAFLLDYGVYLAVTATVLFPIVSYFRSGSLGVLLTSGTASAIVFFLHLNNLRRAISHEDPIHVRNGLQYIKKKNTQ